MLLPTTDFSTILKDDRFNVERLTYEKQHMRLALLKRREVWQTAIVRSRCMQLGGMMLIREASSGCFHVLYCEKADCGRGESDAATRITASILGILDNSRSAEAILRFLKCEKGIIMHNLHAEQSSLTVLY